MLLLISCGEPTVDLDKSLYEEKIVIEAFPEIDKVIRNIRITRNFPINVDINFSELIISDAIVNIEDLSTNTNEQLDYSPLAGSYEDSDNSFGIIKRNTRYRLTVSATINGKNLTASSVSLSPAEKVAIELTSQDKLKYFSNFGNDLFKYRITPVSNAEIYVSSLQALSYNFSDFIKPPTNVYIRDNEDVKNEANFNGIKKDLSRSIDAYINAPAGLQKFEREILWWDLHFYSQYRLIVFTGDQNYEDYLMTYRNVQGQDGNLREPKFKIDGDGIGVFSIVSADTLIVEVLK